MAAALGRGKARLPVDIVAANSRREAQGVVAVDTLDATSAAGRPPSVAPANGPRRLVDNADPIPALGEHSSIFAPNPFPFAIRVAILALRVASWRRPRRPHGEILILVIASAVRLCNLA